MNAITRRGSAKGLKNVPMDAMLEGDVRACIAYSETDNEVENIVKDALENDEVVALGRVICSA